MEIKEDEHEYEVVDRLRKMLARPRSCHEITETYSLFTCILLWTLQRIRSERGKTPMVVGMKSLAVELQKMKFEEFGLRSATGPNAEEFNEFAISEGREYPMDTLKKLESLRNAVAHGDARKVFPINDNEEGALVGFELACDYQEKCENEPGADFRFSRRTVWKANICLNREGMVATGDKLAQLYCDAAIDASQQSLSDKR